MSKHLLIELGCEEIPSRFIDTLLADMSTQIQGRLQGARIPFDSANIQCFATYRRLAFRLSGLADKQEDGEEVFKGPPLAIAKNEAGDWLPPAQGFAKKVGVELADLANCVGKDAKGREILMLKRTLKGADTLSVLPTLIKESLSSLSLPIAMRWGRHSASFFRPVHWLVALFGETVIPIDFFDVSSGAVSRGHRFLTQSSDGSIDGVEIKITSAAAYESQLEAAFVCVDSKKRGETIVSFLKKHGQENYDQKLLNEVVYLVESPCPLVGKIKAKHLDLPKDVLVQSMAIHQKYFPVFKDGTLMDSFLFIGDSITEQNKATVIEGNERVLGARLDDAMFFWEEDLKTPLASLVPKLDAVLFQKGLGSVLEKTKRIDTLACYVSKLWETELKRTDVSRVALLCKADLVSQMVYEFPDLQGIMGELYADKSGESKAVSKAVREHYYPLSSSSALPSNVLGAVVSMADKVDTIVACYQNGLIPSGSKDPLGVRRAMLGMLGLSKHFGICNFRTLFQKGYDVLGQGCENFDALKTFFEHRLKTFIEEQADVSHDIAEAVLAISWTDLNKALAWAQELSACKRKESSQYKDLVETAIRVSRLSKKGAADSVDEGLFEHEIETSSFHQLSRLNDLKSVDDLTPLVTELKQYFDDVLVMAESESIKENRLGFLRQVEAVFTQCFYAESLVVE